VDSPFQRQKSSPVAQLLQAATIQKNIGDFILNAQTRVRELEARRGFSGPVEPIALLSDLSRLDYDQIAKTPAWTPTCVYADMFGDLFEDAVIYIGHACDYRGIPFFSVLAQSLDLALENLVFYDSNASRTVPAPTEVDEAHLVGFRKIGSEAASSLDEHGYMSLSGVSVAAALRQLRLFAEDVGIDAEYQMLNAASVWLSLRSSNPLGVSIHIFCPRI
jgi:hypothetical protein